MKPMNDDDAFVERIAQPLRASEQVRPDFDIRVMSGLHGATFGSRRQSRPWWIRPRVYRATPLATLALAAGVVLLLVGGTWGAARLLGGGETQPAAVAAQPDTVHVVRFVFVDSAATRVALVGSFNQWQKGATLFEPTGVPGVWAVEVRLPTGQHEYAFVVSGEGGDTERWVADPLAPRRMDDFGTESSVISLRPAS